MGAVERLEAFLRWRGWSQGQLSTAIDLHQTTVSKILAGQRRPGLEVVHAIERVTSAPNDDGAKWPPGPIRTEEWLVATIEPASGSAVSRAETPRDRSAHVVSVRKRARNLPTTKRRKRAA